MKTVWFGVNKTCFYALEVKLEESKQCLSGPIVLRKQSQTSLLLFNSGWNTAVYLFTEHNKFYVKEFEEEETGL